MIKNESLAESDSDDLVDRLDRLAALRRDGALTPEQFEAAKNQLLEVDHAESESVDVLATCFPDESSEATRSSSSPRRGRADELEWTDGINWEDLPLDWAGDGAWETPEGNWAAPHTHWAWEHRQRFPNPTAQALHQKAAFEETSDENPALLPRVGKRQLRKLYRRSVPSSFVGSYEMFCPRCCFGTRHDQLEVLEGGWLGFGFAFGAPNTVKSGTRSLWSFCSMCVRATPDDHEARQSFEANNPGRWMGGMGPASEPLAIECRAVGIEALRKKMIESIGAADEVAKADGDKAMLKLCELADDAVSSSDAAFSAALRVGGRVVDTRVWMLPEKQALQAGACKWKQPGWRAA